MSLKHGGNLLKASARFGTPAGEWIDLSTGISPWSWPVPPVPGEIWQRLPEEDDGLPARAATYYRCPEQTLLALPGSQYAISRLPALFEQGPVALPHWGYREHHLAWRRAGHPVVEYRNASQLRELVMAGTVRHALVINPGNPDTTLLAPALLEELAEQLARLSGQLVVDEAFMDPYPPCSLIPRRPPNAVILRSLGKFFGLAGVRLGFAVADPALLARLAAGLDPWAVSHPARWLGRLALADPAWQVRQRLRLENQSARWHRQLCRLFPGMPWRRSALFVSAETSEAPRLFHLCARRALLLRLYDDREVPLIRCGLPTDTKWERVTALLDQIRRTS